MRKIYDIIHQGHDIEIRMNGVTYASANVYIKDLFLGIFTRNQLFPMNKVDGSFDKAISKFLTKLDAEDMTYGCDIKRENGKPRNLDKIQEWELHLGTNNQSASHNIGQKADK